MNEATIYPTEGGRELIQNRTLLGNAIGFSPRFMAYAGRKRRSLQKRKDLGKRTVYMSRSPLSFIQQRMGEMLACAFDGASGNEMAIACRKGFDVRHHLAVHCAGCKVLVKTDVVGYYDHVTKRKVKTALKGIGYTGKGAGTIARYLLVDRDVKGEYEIETLQQGSSASPAAANIVGREYLDVPVSEWLKEHCRVPYQYYRYSDNIALFLHEDPGQEWIEEYKAFVRETAARGRFRTHSWATLRPTNKAMAQQFLGIVLNRTANIERRKRDWLKGVMFKALVSGILPAAEKWCELHGFAGNDMSARELKRRFAMSMVGYAAYAMNVNWRHGTRMMKLARLIEICVNEDRRVMPARLSLVKRYRLDGEQMDNYLKMARQALA